MAWNSLLLPDSSALIQTPLSGPVFCLLQDQAQFSLLPAFLPWPSRAPALAVILPPCSEDMVALIIRLSISFLWQL